MRNANKKQLRCEVKEENATYFCGFGMAVPTASSGAMPAFDKA